MMNNRTTRNDRVSSKLAGFLNSVGVLGLCLGLLFVPTLAGADSVAQVQTAKRISRQTVVLIDPQGRPTTGGTTTTDTTVQPGDILTYVIQFTPVPNGSNRGLGGYITDYIPMNTEVVGARIVDRNGNTVPPHRGGLSADGVGPRGPRTFTPNTLPQGSMSQLYADTGIFFSTDPRTARSPDGSVAGEAFVSLFNGLPMNPNPTGVGNLQQLLGGGATPYAHNLWDLAQVYAFGVKNGAIGSGGQGVAPDMYGSPVAGPETWYQNEATWDWWDVTNGVVLAPTIGTIGSVDLAGNPVVGPWKRIQTLGSETGMRGATPDPTGAMPDPGPAMHIGVPAVDGTGQLLGWALSADNALPSYDAVTYDPADSTTWYTTAVRFAVGELVVGDEYFAEISLRVKDTPLDPVSGMDLNCAEVTGGDASAEQANGSKGGKDNAWRYFLPAPSCVVLNNFFELSVDKLLALPGDPLVYTVEGKNLSTNTQTTVIADLCYTAADLNFVSADFGGVNDPAGTGCPLSAAGAQSSVHWAVGDLLPGQDFLYTANFTVTANAGNDMTIARAVYTSDQLPVPGFQVVAATTVVGSSLIHLGASVAPSSVQVQAALAAVHYDVTVANDGTLDADVAGCAAPGCRVIVDLPVGFSYSAGTATVDTAAVADPSVAGTQLAFSNGLVLLAPAQIMTIGFDVTVPMAHPAGAYTLAVESWLADVGMGNVVVDSVVGVAELLVDTQRTAAPTIAGTLVGGGTQVSGSAEANATVVVMVNGVPVATVTADASGNWSATVPSLFPGQVVEASAEATGKLVSPNSAASTVAAGSTVTACNDGLDNDSDGLTDFPSDPGCLSASDQDETDPPECADTVDNDGDGLTDYPNDPKCASFADNSESGLPECSDGVDNDGNGLMDFPDDSGCSAADDALEATPSECNDGLDNDGDGLIDYPLDDGCNSALDNTELLGVVATDGGPTDSGATDGGSGDAGAADGGNADGGGAADAGPGRTDPGGIELKGVKGGGCCNNATAPGGNPGLALFALLGLGVLVPRRRRR